MKEFDVVVVGAGPGGYVCAIRAAQSGKKVAIIERKWLGGVCLNVGCIPSKALLRNADLAFTMSRHASEYGISFEKLELDYGAAFKRSRQVSTRLSKGVAFLMKKNNIEVLMGDAKFSGKDTLEVTLNDGGAETVKAKDVVIATGAHAMVIPGMEPDGEKVLDYSQAILLEKLPNSAVIIGGGAIGVEFATVWSGYGVDVRIVEMLPHLLPNQDAEAAAELQKAFTKRGVKFSVGTKVKSIEKTGTGTKVTLENEKGEQQILEADIALVSVGFKPNTAELGLDKLGVELDRRGFVVVDDHMRTNVDGIWAIGDVTGKMLLAHAASAMGLLCAEAIAGEAVKPIDFKMVPSATYTSPQVAGFGYTEEEAHEAGKEIKVGRFNFQANGKALGLNEAVGFAKIITDAKYGEILGAVIVGPEASELLPELTLAQGNELTSREIARNIHAHPTLSEVLMEAAGAAEGQAIHS